MALALSQRERLLLAVPVALGVIFLFYEKVHEPLFERRAEASSRLESTQSEIKQNQTRLAKEGNLRTRRDAVTAREQTIDSWVPGKNSAALFIWYLSQAEMHSGAHIKGIAVSDRKQVTAATGQPSAQQQTQPQPNQQTGQPNQQAAQPNQQAAQPNQQAAQTAGNAQAGNAVDATGAPMLTMIRLDLKVDGQFAEQLFFNQALEEMPLFLNTGALSIGRTVDQTTSDRVGKLLQSGNSWLASQLMKASPKLEGSYQVYLYFKAPKQGPTTEAMQFTESTGRSDPFAMDGVDEFLDFLTNHYANQDGNTGGSTTLPADGRTPGQMG